MARPTTKEKDLLASAIANLRESLGESQQQFANRLGTSQPVVGRYETNYPPNEKILRRLLAIAAEAGHESATAFAASLEIAEFGKRLRQRYQRITELKNLAKAETVLTSIWETVSDARQTPATKKIAAGCLELADLLFITGRKQLTGPHPTIAISADGQISYVGEKFNEKERKRNRGRKS
jgi:transcriptional regulator with XRE-family HTH domain